jgi:hypothetical protein|tara:strand:+ start:366 stop:854 length:489 start_codon:yes stop_codon:yes gene_type:complete
MKRTLLVLGVTLLGLPAQADITHKIQSSIQLSVDGAGSVAAKIPSTYSVSGSNITLDTAGGLGTLTAGSAVGYTPAAYSVTTAGDAFSYTESFVEGDDTPSATTVTSGVVSSLPMLGSTTTTSGGVAGDLDGTIDSGGALSITAGGAGTTAIGQVIQELTIK